MSWKSEVQIDSSGKWYGNALRFATEQEAKDSAYDLALCWLVVRDYRAIECSDPVNYAWIDGKLVSITLVDGEPVVIDLPAKTTL